MAKGTDMITLYTVKNKITVINTLYTSRDLTVLTGTNYT